MTYELIVKIFYLKRLCYITRQISFNAHCDS